MNRNINSLTVSTLFIAIVFSTHGALGKQPKQYTIEEFLDTTSYFGSSFSPDKSTVLVTSDASGIFNVYAIPVDGSSPRQLTQSKSESIFGSGFFPEDERFIYSSDQGGNELNHVFVRELDGSARDLTPGEKLKAAFYGWSQDEKTFYVATTERDERYFDVYEYDPKTYQRTMLYQNDEGYDFAAVTSDRRYVALNKTVSNSDSDVYLYDRQTKRMTLITDDTEPVENSVQAISPDDKYLYYTTNKDHEFSYLVRRDLASGQTSELIKLDWDVAFAYLSQRGTYLVVGVNDDGRTQMTMYEVATMQPVALPELEEASISSVNISRDETMVTMYATSSRMPRDLFVYELSGGKPKQLTRSLNPNIDPSDLVEGEVIRFTSYDGLEIPGILYKPRQASHEHRVPALVSVHGGPGGQSRIGYNALTQYLVNHGYTVYEINNRGSSGYGKTFYHLDDRKHGDADLDDVVASKQMLASLDYVDGDRIGIIGGSYGGYMTLAALTFRPEEFNAGVDIFGISNWHRTVQNIPPWWESFRVALEQEMGDFDDEEFFKAKSPLFHASNIRRPLMVLQGANDPRVLRVESDEIVAAVRANGVPVEYIIFDDEGHGFLKKANRIRGYRAVLQFLDEHLKGEG